MEPVHRHQVQTIGIIGIGRIGGSMAHKTHALGMKVIAHDPYVSRDKVPDYVTLVSLEELLEQSDVVSVHCPLLETTRFMLDEKMLRLMKPSAYLVNTARGSIVDEVALEKMLGEGKLAGAAMDVLRVEPGAPDHPLFKHENFLCTPHMAWHSEESAKELKRKVAEEARRVLRGEAPLYQVNKF
jgi:D-3-phosphoglycerate dehydrogenase